MKNKFLISMGMAAVIATSPLYAANTRAEFDARLAGTISVLNRLASDIDGAILLTELVQRDYETPREDLNWALAEEFSWGEIVAFAYIRATTGQSFSELGGADARKDFWGFTERTGMSPEKMANSLDLFVKRVERERNSRIFDRMRSSRRVARMPDLGSGFGLFQEGLDFRRLEPPRPVKSHLTGPGELVKGGK